MPKRPKLTPEELAASYAMRFKKTRPAPKAHPLVRKLSTLMNQQSVSRAELCETAGISTGTFTSWRTAYSPSLPALEACFNVLGKRLIVGNMGDDPK